MISQPININPHTHVWQVQHGNPTKPNGIIYVGCVGKATAQITAGQLGLKRIFVATPIERTALPENATIHPGVSI